MPPSCAQSAASTTEASQQEAIASCLERLSTLPGHFQAKRLAFEIRDVGFTPGGSLATLQLLARWIFERACTDPERLAGPCAALCFSLTPILPTFKPPGALTPAAKAKRIDFRQTLLNLCQREFEAGCNAAFSGASQTAAEAAVQEAEACGSGGGAAAAQPLPAADRLSSSLQFLACLYLHHLLTDRIMLSCLVTVASGHLGHVGGGVSASAGGGEEGGSLLLLRGGNVPQRVECLVRALLIAGRQLDECLAEPYRLVLDGLFNQLEAHKAPTVFPKLPVAVQTSLAQLFELRARRWANGGSGVWAGAPPDGAVVSASSAARANGNGHGHGVASRHRAASTSALADAAAAAISSASKPARDIIVTTVYRSSGRLTVAAPGCAAAAAVAVGRSSSPGVGRWSASSGSTPTSDAAVPTAAAAAGNSAGLTRRHAGSGSSNGCGGGGTISRAASQSQNLEGLWELSPETYGEVRAQLLSQPVANSPATLEAMADELVESAIAASGGDNNYPCWDPQPLHPEASGPAAAAAAAAAQAATAAPPRLSEAEWSALVQQQWDAQCAACDIYVRLCVDALQQMSTAPPSATSASPTPAAGLAAGCNGAIPAAALLKGHGAAVAAAPTSAACAAGAVTGDTGRAFRRLLLSSAQIHFERCLATLLPMPPPSSAAATAGAEAEAAPVPRRDWGDLPLAAPDTAAALPRARGVCHLLLGLLRNGILTPRIVLHCAAALVDGAAGGSTGCLQCACVLLAGAGKQASTFKVAEAAAFESLLKRLQGMAEAADRAAAANATAAAATGSAAADKAASAGGGGTAAGTAGDNGFEDASARELHRRFLSWLMMGLRVRQ